MVRDTVSAYEPFISSFKAHCQPSSGVVYPTSLPPRSYEIVGSITIPALITNEVMFVELGWDVLPSSAISEVGPGDEVGAVEVGDADDATVALDVRTVGGALEGDSDDDDDDAMSHVIPAKQLVPSGQPNPVGQAVASEQIAMASS